MSVFCFQGYNLTIKNILNYIYAYIHNKYMAYFILIFILVNELIIKKKHIFVLWPVNVFSNNNFIFCEIIIQNEIILISKYFHLFQLNYCTNIYN